jgi:Amt family ammonium transporter
MRTVLHNGKKLTFSDKLSRLAVRLRDPEWRRYGGALLGGKMLGLGLMFLIITVVWRVLLHRACVRHSGEGRGRH